MLNEWLANYDQAQTRLTALVDGLDPTAANRRPAPRRWSVNECLAHLAITAGTYCDRMEPSIARARERGLSGTEPHGRGTWIGRFILANLRQGSAARRVPVPGVFRPPASGLDLAAQVGSLQAVVDRIAALARDADGLPLGRVTFATPVSPLVRVSLEQAFEIQALHLHRHLDQAERVKREVAA